MGSEHLEAQFTELTLRNDKQNFVSSAQDIAGCSDALSALREIVLWPIKYAREGRILGLKWALGCLLHGPPGVGKTLLVRVRFVHSHRTPQGFQPYPGPSATCCALHCKQTHAYNNHFNASKILSAFSIVFSLRTFVDTGLRIVLKVIRNTASRHS